MVKAKEDSVLSGSWSLMKEAWFRSPGRVATLIAGRTLVSVLEIAPYLVLGAVVSAIAVDAPEVGTVVMLILLYCAVWAAWRVLSGLLLLLYGHVEQRVQTEYIVGRMSEADQAGSIARQTISDSELSFAIDNGAEGVRNAMHSLYEAVFGSLVGVLIGAAVLYKIGGPVVTSIFAGAAVVFVAVSFPLVREHQRRQKSSIDAAMKSFGVLQNTLSVWRDVRMLNAGSYLRDRYRLRRRPFETRILATYRSTVKLSVAQAFVVYGSLALMLVSLVLSQEPGQLDAGQIVAVVGVSLAALAPLEALGFGFSQLTVGLAQMQQTRGTIDDLQDARADVRPADVVVRSGSEECGLTADALTISSLDGGHVIETPTLDLTPGRPLWIIGGSGSGKTILIEGLSGFAPVKGGAVVISHPDDRDVPFMHVSQRDAILEDTIAFNMSMGRNGSRDPAAVVVECGLAQTAQSARERLSDAAAGEGARLSGGELRRLLLGRALAADPAVIFCDEPTGGLDRRNRRLVWDRLIAEAEHRVVVIATHDADAPIAPGDTVLDVERLIVEPQDQILKESRSRYV